MADTHLVFDRARVATPGAVALVFGDDGGTPPVAVDVTLYGAGRVSGLRLHINASSGTTLLATGKVTGLRLHVTAGFDINVSRPTVGGSRSHWQDAVSQPHAARSGWQESAPMPVGTHSRWQDAVLLDAVGLRACWQTAQPQHRTARSAFEQALRLPGLPLAACFEEAGRLRSHNASAFEQALRLAGAPLGIRFEETLRDRQAQRQSRFEVAARLPAAFASGMGIARRTLHVQGGRFQEAWTSRPGQWRRPGPKPPEPCYVPGLPAHLLFADPFDGTLPAHLVFACERRGPGPNPQPGVVVPIRKVYVTLNSITLIRLSDGMSLPAESFSLSIDTDSWTWQWSASMQPHLRQRMVPVDGKPVQVQATINDMPYVLCAESITSDRSFGQARIAVRGRGLGAVLDAPYAPALNFENTAAALNAQQLTAAALTFNGVGIGWDVDWQLQDWPVPAGAWSHQGTYLSAVTTIAAAAGGYVQPHATLPTLRILPRYPVAPWNWASVVPDFALPADVVSVEGIEWTTKPAYSRVHVSGQARGVLAEVTRAGTAGNHVAPMVTDPLITHADAARQRGLAVLADTGAQARVTLTLPVLQETGLILPGKFVRYSDGAVQRTGIVRGCSLGWSRPTLRQTLQIETHGSD